MRITFTESAWDDYLWLQNTNRKLLKRVNQLIKDIVRSPFEGIGKAEPLKGICQVVGRAELITSIGSYIRWPKTISLSLPADITIKS